MPTTATSAEAGAAGHADREHQRQGAAEMSSSADGVPSSSQPEREDVAVAAAGDQARRDELDGDRREHHRPGREPGARLAACDIQRDDGDRR